MKKCSLVCALLLLTGVLAACGRGGSSAATAPMAMDDSAAEIVYGEAQDSKGLVENKSVLHSMTGSVDSAIYQDPNAKIIRSAEMTIQTTEFDQSVTALSALTQKQGGYYETAEVMGGGINSQNARRSAYYVVRVPKENFATFRDSLGEVGHLYSINENTQDVGESYYDTEARLETLTTKRERLLSLLEKAELMEDIIALEDALADVQYEIDAHTTTLRKYDSLIDFSTFRIHLNETVKIEKVGEADGFGARLAASFKEGLSDFGEGVQDLILWTARNIMGLVVFGAVVVAGILGCRKICRKRRSAKAEKSVPPAGEEK